MQEFQLDDRLARDTFHVLDWPLSSVRLMNERTWPWLVLVPRRPGLAELHDLSAGDLAALTGEIARASHAVAAICAPDKVNVGALGNIVRQLHVHVVGRFATDPAWPRPVWSHQPPVPYREDELARILAVLQLELA